MLRHVEEVVMREESAIHELRRNAGLFVLLGLLALPASASGQAAPPAAPPAGDQTQTTQQSQAAPQAAVPAAPGVVLRKESRLVLVDAVVTDKHGNYIRDLAQKDFRVYEDNKEQQLSSFSFGADEAAGPKSAKHYMVFFFDNSSMEQPDQIAARSAAGKFIEANTSPDNLMAVVDFGGTLRIAQNFTANTAALKASLSGVKTAFVASNAPAGKALGAAPETGLSAGIPMPGLGGISGAEADYGARTTLLAIRSLAKSLRSVPGRKVVVLFSAGFPLTPETQSELTATIDACNKANVSIYPVDARGLVARAPGGLAQAAPANAGPRRLVARRVHKGHTGSRPRLVLAAFGDPQHAGGGAPGGGGRPGGGGGMPGGGSGGGRTGGGGTGTGGGSKGTGGGTTGGGGHGTAGGGGRTGGGYSPGYNNYNSPYNNPRTILPHLPESPSNNQEILRALADGTGGFTIFNTNDLLGGLNKIAADQNEFYLLGYVPAESPEGSCHTLRVKLDRGGTNVRSRSGYCNARAANILDGTPVEKQLEARARDTQPGASQPALQAPYFYTAPNVARVNVAMDIPASDFQFEKEKGKYHASLNVLGIAYRENGEVGARFSDQVKLDLEKDDWKAFEKQPYRYENQFDAAAGSYRLTVVLSAASGSFGKAEVPLTIDGYDGQHLSLGSVVITKAMQLVSEIATTADLDATLLEDRTPLVVKGREMIPEGANRFNHQDEVAMYTEIYEPELASAQPLVLGVGYRVLEAATKKQVFSTGLVRADDFEQKGNPVVPVGLRVQVKDLPAGKYILVVQAADSLGREAPQREVGFEVLQ